MLSEHEILSALDKVSNGISTCTQKCWNLIYALEPLCAAASSSLQPLVSSEHLYCIKKNLCDKVSTLP